MRQAKSPVFLISLLMMISALIATQSAFAHPVTYKEATSVMLWNQPYLTDAWVTYTFHRKAAIAARYMRMRMKDHQELNAYLPQLDLLLYRWNEKKYQANIYAYGGFGGLNDRDRNGRAALAGAEADFETRRIYLMAEHQTTFPSFGKRIYQTTGRVGLAPYLAEYDELASWVMVQTEYHPGMERKFAVSPLARVFYKNFLLEAGSSTRGDWMINFMAHY